MISVRIRPTVSSGPARLAERCAEVTAIDRDPRMIAAARLLRPGGRLAVIGLAADKSLADLLAAAPGVPVHQFYRAIHHQGDPGAPIMDPDMSWREVRQAAATTLPGVRYRRHLLWRYSLRWHKPT
jgi:hypothetical protein